MVIIMLLRRRACCHKEAAFHDGRMHRSVNRRIINRGSLEDRDSSSSGSSRKTLRPG